MNKLIVLFIVVFVNSSCNTQYKAENKFSSLSDTYDSIIFWKKDNLKSSNFFEINEMTSLSDVKDLYSINNLKLYSKSNQKIVSDIKLQLRTDSLMGIDVNIHNGFPYGTFCDFKDGVTCRMEIQFDKEGNLNGLFSVQDYKTNFKKGNGLWKDYYLFKNSIKEEGKVKNNFKSGEWRYYNQEGIIDSIKTYTLKDSIDVRFPHCIFNKIEPCY